MITPINSFFSQMHYLDEQLIISKLKKGEAVLIEKDRLIKLEENNKKLEEILYVISKKESNYGCATITNFN